MIIIHQNPNLAKTGGYEKIGKNLASGSKVSFGIPVVNNRLKLALKEEQLKTIETFFGIKLDSAEAISFYNEKLIGLTDKIISWDLTDPRVLLTYGAAVQAGILAESRNEIENPFCQAIYYVYDSYQ